MNTKRLILGLGSLATIIGLGGAALFSGIVVSERDEAVYAAPAETIFTWATALEALVRSATLS